MNDVVNVFFSYCFNLVKNFRVYDLLDIGILSFLIYNIIKLVRETRAEQLVKGIFILVVAWIISLQLNLKMLTAILNNVFQFGVIALLVVFQPELRRALEQIGRTHFGSYWYGIMNPTKNTDFLLHRIDYTIDIICNTVVILSKQKTGALIIFERRTKLGEIVDTGTILDADVSQQLIENIFFNKAPLHDGAMIIRDGKVISAGCILPLTKNENLSANLGTRHRAALGVSEVSDSIALVVSEETGTISLAINGIIKRNYSKDMLNITLKSELLPQNNENERNHSLLSSFWRFIKNDKK